MSVELPEDVRTNIVQAFLKRWSENDASIVPLYLVSNSNCTRWSDQLRECLARHPGAQLHPDQLVKLLQEVWLQFRQDERGKAISNALLENLRVGGQTGQVWIEDLMAIVNYCGENDLETLRLLDEVVAFTTSFTTVAPYTREKTQLLSVVLAEVTNSLLVASSEPQQLKKLSAIDICRYNADRPNLIKRTVFGLLDEHYICSNQVALRQKDDEALNRIIDPSFIEGTPAGEIIATMCARIYLACWRVLQGRTDHPEAFDPTSIKNLIIYFELSFFWAHRAVSAGISLDKLNKNTWVAFSEVLRAARPEFEELIASYSTNQPIGIFPRLHEAWLEATAEALSKLGETSDQSTAYDLLSTQGEFARTAPQSWSEQWESVT